MRDIKDTTSKKALKKTYRPSLLKRRAETLLEANKAWNVNGLNFLLLEILRRGRYLINNQTREECWNAAKDAIAKHEEEDTIG